MLSVPPLRVFPRAILAQAKRAGLSVLLSVLALQGQAVLQPPCRGARGQLSSC